MGLLYVVYLLSTQGPISVQLVIWDYFSRVCFKIGSRVFLCVNLHGFVLINIQYVKDKLKVKIARVLEIVWEKPALPTDHKIRTSVARFARLLSVL